MIEIHHQQARRLLKSALDSQIPADQWNAVQNHLETCPDCRILYSQLKQEERHIRRSLHTRWDGVSGPSRGIFHSVMQARRERAEKRRRSAAAASLAVSIMLVIFALNNLVGQAYEVRNLASAANVPVADETISPQIGTAVSATRIPLAEPGMFKNILAYESDVDGNSEIYLYNPGGKPVNLTNNPARDTDPAWSPDGEWLAFLSDRSAASGRPGKKELYVMSVAGNQLVQITNTPDTDWHGPVTWSSDGQWITIIGAPLEIPGQQELHAFPVNRLVRQMVGSILLEETQGEWTSPGVGDGDGMYFWRFPDGWLRLQVRYVRVGSAGTYTIDQSMLDGMAGGQLTTTEKLSTGSAKVPVPSDFSALSIPVTGKGDAQASGCQKLYAQKIQIIDGRVLVYHQLFNGWPGDGHVWATNDIVLSLASIDDDRLISSGPYPDSEMKPPSAISQICVDGELDQANWAHNDRWLVVVGHLSGDKKSALYAVRMPEQGQGEIPQDITYDPIPVWTTLKLVDDADASTNVSIRPVHEKLEITP